MSQSTQTVRDVFRIIRDREIKFIDLKFVDLFGALHHYTLAVEAFDEDTFLSGVGFDGSSVRGFTEIHKSDMLLMPDPQTAYVDPFGDDPTLSLFCNILNPDSHDTYSRCVRGIAQRAERYLDEARIGDTAYFGPELEFFLFDDVRFDQTSQHGYYFIDAEGAFWNRGENLERNLGHKPPRKRGYFVTPPSDKHHNMRSKMVSILREIGVPAELHHHEVGAGQQELGWTFGTLTRQADHSVSFKYIIKNLANRYGKTATFMPKPLFEENGSGMHVHCSIWKEGTNQFYEEGPYADLSDMARHFIAGLLKHAPALCAFCAPTTNSYRRLVPGYEAPINLAYSQRNRSACVRIPAFATSPKSKRVEFRTPDPSCNPYLAFAAILMAGIDGIQNKLEAPDPVDEDIYKLAAQGKADHIGRAPGSLEESIGALEKDHDFLLRGGVFTEDVIRTWIDEKRQNEINYLRLRPHPSEFDLYFNT